MQLALRNTVKKSLQQLSKAINGDAKTEPQTLFKVFENTKRTSREVAYVQSRLHQDETAHGGGERNGLSHSLAFAAQKSPCSGDKHRTLPSTT